MPWLAGMWLLLAPAGARAQFFFGLNDPVTNALVLVGDMGTTNSDNFGATSEPLEPRPLFGGTASRRTGLEMTKELRRLIARDGNSADKARASIGNA